MDRELNTLNYLPQYLHGFKELQEIHKVGSRMLIEYFDNIQRVLNNNFLEDADEYGVSRWEKLLSIIPKSYYTLADRKLAIKTRLNSDLPYTFRVLEKRIKEIVGEGNYTIVTDYLKEYYIGINVITENVGQIKELENVIGDMMPCNMTYGITNVISVERKGIVNSGGSVIKTDIFEIKER